ncbi:MAG: orotidine-5'-phosphate decarboxylase [Phycisphaerales bacterium]|nr:MAG: orotidine-5'-phosphate decarboxylase [Phycisphaerales bacterium]
MTETTDSQSPPAHAADRLIEAIERLAAPVCVGIDPVVERLPAVTESGKDPQIAAGAIRSFVLGLLDAAADCVPCVKFQSACFERYGHRGIAILEELIAEARQRNLQVILDAKRGDIGISADHYAAAVFDSAADRSPHWLTINSYLGEDGIQPFLREGRGAFALVRTSNPGGDALQRQKLADGRTIAECVAGMIAAIGRDFVGKSGYSALGAVVGATRSEDAAKLRKLMPQQIFLVPGYGAQGGGVQDVLPCFNVRGRGAIVTASRSVIYAFEKDRTDWQLSVTEAAKRFADEIGSAVGLR